MPTDPLDTVRSSTRALDRLAASRDLWPGGTLDFWQARDAPMPDRVFWPEDEAALGALLTAASDRGVPVIPYGAGSGVCGGARGREGAWVVDTKAFDDLGEVDARRWTVEAGAGVNGQQLEDWLQRHGFTLGHSPSSLWCSTVGGWAAARSAGQFSSRYGVFEDMVLGLRVVSPGRGAFQVGEDGDAPPEWLPQLLGSEGTLGVMTRVRMRIWPAPETRWLRGYRFSSVSAAIRAMRRLMQGELWPSVVRLYDPVDTRIGGKTNPKGDARRPHDRFYARWLRHVDALDAVRRRSLVLPLALPRVVNHVFGRMASGCLLIVGWEGKPAVVEASSAVGHRLLCEEGDDLGPEPGERWLHARHAVSYKLMPIFERGGFADTMEVAVRWSRLESLYEAVRAAVRETAVVMAHMSHVYPEGASIYFSFAGRGDAAVYQRTWAAALEAVLAQGGTVTHHHGVGHLKAQAASQEVGPAIEGWRSLKRTLDPQGILNPGRLFVDTPYRDPGPAALDEPEDGLARSDARADLAERSAAADRLGGELLWPWESLPAPPRWQRLPWQVGAVEVAGRVNGQRCRLGRGPRSAAGPDLRTWLLDHAADLTVTEAVAPSGSRWLGRGRPKAPWAVARELLRNDLRPAILTVRDGDLLVGFRGPAARELGAVAAAWVPGGLQEVSWRVEALPSGPLEPCAIDDPSVVAVLPQGALRRAGEGA